MGSTHAHLWLPRSRQWLLPPTTPPSRLDASAINRIVSLPKKRLMNLNAEQRSHVQAYMHCLRQTLAQHCRSDRCRCAALCAPIQPSIHRYSAPNAAWALLIYAFSNRFCTKIDRFINVCVIIHSFTRAQSWLTSSRWKMTYCCCSRTSFEYLGEGGRGVQTWWKGLLAFTDTWWYFMKQHTLHVQAGSCTAIISERNVHFQFVRNWIWDSRLFDRRPAFAL